MVWSFDSATECNISQAPVEIFSSFFKNLTVAAGIVRVHFDDEGNAVDMELKYVNKLYSTVSIIARRIGLPEDAPISSVLNQRWIQDFHLPEEEILHYARTYGTVLKTQKGGRITIKGEDGKSKCLGYCFPLEGAPNCCGFLTEDLLQKDQEMTEQERRVKSRDRDLQKSHLRFKKL